MLFHPNKIVNNLLDCFTADLEVEVEVREGILATCSLFDPLVDVLGLGLRACDSVLVNFSLLDPVDVADCFRLVFPCAGESNFELLPVTILSADFSRLILDGCEGEPSLLCRVSFVLEGALSSV